jgi:hypothetical protein
MTCFDYDHYFAQDLSAKCASPSMSRKTSSHSGRSSARATRATHTITHGRHISARLPDALSDDEDKDGVDSEEN